MIEVRGLCKEFERSRREGGAEAGTSGKRGVSGKRVFGRKAGNTREKSGRGKIKKESFLAVDHVSLEARDGEIIGILGPNGAGKTTLLRMMGMLMSPTEGRVVLTDGEGREITELTQKKAAIGYLSGNTKLYPRFSVREYLGFLGELYGFDKDLIKRRSAEIFKVLDMEGFADNRIEKLSTGQTQRASIARCLMADPQVYILDEPTLGLDILSADAIIRFMREQKENGKTVLYSTHYLEEAQILCDRIYMIRDGKIVANGTPAALMRQTDTDNLRAAFHVIYDDADALKRPGDVCMDPTVAGHGQ